MSLQWTIVATFLYTQLAVCVVLMLPFVSATSWRKFFKSRFFNFLTAHGHIYYFIFHGLLLILFGDGVKDVYRYSQPLSSEEAKNPLSETNIHMKLFRAQRNFYIAGFALFLSFILRRLVNLLSTHGALLADLEAAKRQAESASAAAKHFMENQQNKTNEEDVENKLKKQLEKSQETVSALKDELSRSKADHEAMKRQAESTNREYDRLQQELAKLQEKLKQHEGGSDTKKDD